MEVVGDVASHGNLHVRQQHARLAGIHPSHNPDRAYSMGPHDVRNGGVTAHARLYQPSSFVLEHALQVSENIVQRPILIREVHAFTDAGRRESTLPEGSVDRLYKQLVRRAIHRRPPLVEIHDAFDVRILWCRVLAH
jgi:hypothetical protein